MDAEEVSILMLHHQRHTLQIYPDAFVVITEFTADFSIAAVHPVVEDVFPTLGLRVINHTVPLNPFF